MNKLVSPHMIVLVCFLLVACGRSPTTGTDVEPRKTDDNGPVVIEPQKSPDGVKRNPDDGPVVGGRPVMPAQKRFPSRITPLISDVITPSITPNLTDDDPRRFS